MPPLPAHMIHRAFLMDMDHFGSWVWSVTTYSWSYNPCPVFCNMILLGVSKIGFLPGCITRVAVAKHKTTEGTSKSAGNLQNDLLKAPIIHLGK